MGCIGCPSFARMPLPPGFRFHPTDVELIMYYLKRKVLGKKLHVEAIAEVNIYQFSPWDLPDKSCLGSKDLEWFFFCPREKKYASGTRVKRATENGYWKTTGKDRSVYYNDMIVGTVKTLVFHLGHPPKGERTDWVIHEYRILDEVLPAAGVQDAYVLCKVFKKNGLGPKNGAQYGAPFNEADWVDDEDADAQNIASSVAPAGPSLNALPPEKHNSLVTCAFQPGSTPALSVTEEGRNTEHSSDVMGLFDPGSTSGQSLTVEGPNGKHSFNMTGLYNPGNTSGLALIEEDPAASAMPLNSEVLVDESDDEIVRLLSSFTDESMLLLNENGEKGIHQDHRNGKRKATSIPGLDEHEVYNGLGDLDNSWMNEMELDFSVMPKDGFPLNNMASLENLDYIELNDLQTPLDFSEEVFGTQQLGQVFGAYSQENMQYFGPAGGFDGIDRYSLESQLPVLPDGSNNENSSLDMLWQISNHFPQVSNAVYDLEFAQRPPENRENGGHHFNQDMERGSQKTKYIPKLLESIPSRLPSAAEHLALSFSSCGGSSIHIKAEVTCGVGECTKEALSVMMEGSSSCWWNMPLADFQAMWLFIAYHLLYSAGGFCYPYCYHYFNRTLFISWSYYHQNCSRGISLLTTNLHNNLIMVVYIEVFFCIVTFMLKTISLCPRLNACKLMPLLWCLFIVFAILLPGVSLVPGS